MNPQLTRHRDRRGHKWVFSLNVFVSREAVSAMMFPPAAAFGLETTPGDGT